MNDIEAKDSRALKNYSNPLEMSWNYRSTKLSYCEYCQFFRDVYTVHCEDCDVCIENYDHHCVFFSKCIGGGNLFNFWGALAGVMVVFGYFAFMTVLDLSL